MNLVILLPEDFTGPETVELKGRRAKHAHAVLNAREGDSIRVGILNGLMGYGTIIASDAESMSLTVKCDIIPPTSLPVTLICAMQRPKTMRKILQSSTAMGVKHIYIIESWKVEKSYWSSPLLTIEEIREELLLGLEQGKDTVMPRVEVKRRFKPFAEDELPDIAQNAYALVAHPGTGMPCPYNLSGEIVIALGPEGGFTDYEVSKFVEVGFTAVSLGERIIRTEFALAALLGRIC